jgi:hypothetical protein
MEEPLRLAASSRSCETQPRAVFPLPAPTWLARSQSAQRTAAKQQLGVVWSVSVIVLRRTISTDPCSMPIAKAERRIGSGAFAVSISIEEIGRRASCSVAESATYRGALARGSTLPVHGERKPPFIRAEVSPPAAFAIQRGSLSRPPRDLPNQAHHMRSATVARVSHSRKSGATSRADAA